MVKLVINKKGSSIVIVLALITVFSTLGIMLLMSNSQTDKERLFFTETQQLYYAAESGITHAYHKLKNNTIDTLWFDDEDELTGNIGKYYYTVYFEKDMENPNLIHLKCETKKGRKIITRKADALYTEKRRIILNSPILCKEEIQKIWNISYK